MKSPIPGGGGRHVDVLPVDSPGAMAVLQVPEAGVSLDALERAVIAFALRRTGGNRTRAAQLLGLTRSALLYRMHKHGLDHAVPSTDDAHPLEIL